MHSQQGIHHAELRMRGSRFWSRLALVDCCEVSRGEAPLHVPAQAAHAAVHAGVVRSAFHAWVLQVEGNASVVRLPHVCTRSRDT